RLSAARRRADQGADPGLRRQGASVGAGPLAPARGRGARASRVTATTLACRGIEHVLFLTSGRRGAWRLAEGGDEDVRLRSDRRGLVGVRDREPPVAGSEREGAR